MKIPIKILQTKNVNFELFLVYIPNIKFLYKPRVLVVSYRAANLACSKFAIYGGQNIIKLLEQFTLQYLSRYQSIKLFPDL